MSKGTKIQKNQETDIYSTASAAPASSLNQPTEAEASATSMSETPSAIAHPAFEEIERRAYEIYLERGGTHGNDVEDWLQAERELLGIE